MNFVPWLIFAAVVVLGTVGQLSLKYAFQAPSSAINNKSIQSLLLSPFFWIWFTSYIVVTVLWLVVLKTIPLSQAFPALGMTFALVPLASNRFLREKVVVSQWFGIAVIITGVILVVQT
jgi:undecaprenyl phosphate-alpha-L-ara4N flippase subunit ArnE